MRVTIDPDSGFCFGVNQAIQIAQDEVGKGDIIYCLGELVHNQVQMDLLKARGLSVISHTDLPAMEGKKVLIRAHGEPPETFQLADKLGITLIDATCPIVLKLQNRIKKSSGSKELSEVQVVIFGKPGHAEVAGLIGNAGGNAIVVSDTKDLDTIDFSKPVRLFSQTTMDAELYQSIGIAIEQRMKNAGNRDLIINKSICKQVSGRAPLLRSFAAEHEVIVFVAGRNSANGAYLYTVCKAVNEKTFYLSTIEDIDNQWFDGVKSVGVSGATSTPGWLLKQIAEKLSTL